MKNTYIRFRMTDFKRDAEENATSWNYLFVRYGISPNIAQYTCRLHGITPKFMKEQSA